MLDIGHGTLSLARKINLKLLIQSIVIIFCLFCVEIKAADIQSSYTEKLEGAYALNSTSPDLIKSSEELISICITSLNKSYKDLCDEIIIKLRELTEFEIEGIAKYRAQIRNFDIKQRKRLEENQEKNSKNHDRVFFLSLFVFLIGLLLGIFNFLGYGTEFFAEKEEESSERKNKKDSVDIRYGDVEIKIRTFGVLLIVSSLAFMAIMSIFVFPIDIHYSNIPLE